MRILHKHLLNIGRYGETTTPLESLFQCLSIPRVKKLFLKSNLNLSWCSFVLFPCILSQFLRSRAQQLPLHFPSSGNCKERSPLSLPQARQPKCPQILLTAYALQPFCQLGCPPLDTFKSLSTFLHCGDQNSTLLKVKPY